MSLRQLFHFANSVTSPTSHLTNHHFANSSLGQLLILPTTHFTNQSFYQPSHFTTYSFCQLFSWSTFFVLFKPIYRPNIFIFILITSIYLRRIFWEYLKWWSQAKKWMSSIFFVYSLKVTWWWVHMCAASKKFQNFFFAEIWCFKDGYLGHMHENVP